MRVEVELRSFAGGCESTERSSVEGEDRSKWFAEKGTAVMGFVVTHVAFTLIVRTNCPRESV